MFKKFILILIGGFILMWIILASPLFSEDADFSAKWEQQAVGSMH